MKKIECEVCGSSDLKKIDDDTFQCSYCGMKYSKIDVQKMLVEVTGPVSVHGIAKADAIRKNADMTYEQGNYKEAFALYNQLINLDPNDEKAVLYRSLSSAWQSSVADCRVSEVSKAVQQAIAINREKHGFSDTHFAFVEDAFKKIIGLFDAVCSLYESYRIKLSYYFAGNAVNTYSAGLITLWAEKNSIEGIVKKDMDMYINKSEGLIAAYLSLLMLDVKIATLLDNNAGTHITDAAFCKRISDNVRMMKITDDMEMACQKERELIHALSDTPLLKFGFSDGTRDEIMDYLVKYGYAREYETSKYNKEKSAREYWATHSEEKANLENNKAKCEMLLSKCGAFDFSRKKELKARIEKITSRLSNPQ